MSVSVTEKQRRSFDGLVEEGVYSDDFDHPPKAKAFVADVIASVLPQLPKNSPLTLLDCGCGTGAWLAFLVETLREQGVGEIKCCGFDLSGKMVEVARRKLAGIAEPENLRPGNVLEEASYAAAAPDGGFDLLFSYDVVQQLPKREQFRACEIMANHLAPGGLAVIFDNDSRSKFGRRMARRKFLTRYCGLSLVPSYYCNAAYPPLEDFRRRLDAGSWSATIHVRPDEIKRALVLSRAHGEAAETKN